MAQGTLSPIDNDTTGADFKTLYNTLLSAFLSMHSGTERPGYAVAGTLWIDISSSNNVVNLYDGSQDIPLMVIDTVNNRARLVLDGDKDTYLAPTGTDGQIGFTAEGSVRAIFASAGIAIGNSSPSASLHCQGNDAIIVPSGTNAQRPTSPVRGMERFNTTSSKFEDYNGSAWIERGSVAAGAIDTDELAAEAVTTGKMEARAVTGAKTALRTLLGENIAADNIDEDHLKGLGTGTLNQAVVSDGNKGFDYADIPKPIYRGTLRTLTNQNNVEWDDLPANISSIDIMIKSMQTRRNLGDSFARRGYFELGDSGGYEADTETSIIFQNGISASINDSNVTKTTLIALRRIDGNEWMYSFNQRYLKGSGNTIDVEVNDRLVAGTLSLTHTLDRIRLKQSDTGQNGLFAGGTANILYQ